MGGVTEDFDEWRQHYGAVTDEELKKWFGEAFNDGKNPFDVLYVLKSKVKSTFPACIAFKAAQMQNKELAHKFLRKMMENAAVECKNISDEKVYLQIAKEVGLDVNKLKKDAKSKKAEEMFFKDKSQMNVNFLSLVIMDTKNKKGVVVGEVFESHPYEHAVEHLTNGKLKKSKPEDVDDYFKEHKNEMIPTREVMIVFGLTEKAAEKRLSDLQRSRLISKKKFDFGDFWIHTD